MKQKHGVVAVVLSILVSWAVAVWAVGEIDINTASVEEMAQSLSGIGQTKAAAIVAYREEHGPFLSVEQLKDVKGIGSSLLERNRPHLVVRLPESTQ